MKTISRPTPYQLADAITDMVLRYGESQRQQRYAAEDMMRARTPEAISEATARRRRWSRACDRRFVAIQRLIEGLRKQADAQ